RRRPFVEAFAEVAHCRIAALGDIGNDPFDRAADFGVGFFLLAFESRHFDALEHESSSSLLARHREEPAGRRTNLDEAEPRHYKIASLRMMWGRDHQAVQPPSTSRLEPVTRAAAGEARNTTAEATSSTVPTR